jgi:hypothetical protein
MSWLSFSGNDNQYMPAGLSFAVRLGAEQILKCNFLNFLT